MNLRLRFAVVAALSSWACNPKLDLPPGANLSCTGDEGCPSGWRCRAERCFDPSAEGTPPDIKSLTLSPNPVRAQVPVDLVLVATEALALSPTITLRTSPATEPLPCDLRAEAEYVCHFTPNGTESQGGVPVDVRMVDLASNEGIRKGAATLTLDFTAPGLAANSVEPMEARFGARIQVFFTASEALTGDGSARVSSSVALALPDGGTQTTFTLLPEPGTQASYRLEHVVTADDPIGPITFTAELEDRAGNTAIATIGATTIDNVLPGLDAGAVTPRLARGDALVVATFSVNKPLARDPDVRAGTLPLVRDLSVPSPGYRYTLQLDGGQGEGPRGVIVELRDFAGNQVIDSLGTVTFDFTPPRVSSATVRYTPAPGSVFTEVSAATGGAQVTIIAFADEPIDAGVQLVALGGLPAPTFTTPGALGSGATFTALVSPATPDGIYQPQVTWTDEALNTVTVPLGVPVVIKTSSPPPVAIEPSVTFLRSPWGAGTSEALDGGFVIPAGPYFALAPADPLSGASTLPAAAFLLGDGGAPAAALRVWADRDAGSLLATVYPLDGGGWPRARLANLDSPSIWVSAFDSAGNESATAKVPWVEWVATPSPSAFANPNRLEEVFFVEDQRTPSPLLSALAPGGPAGAVDNNVLTTSADPTWRKRAMPLAANGPTGRGGPAFAYDPARGRVVMFGGVVGASRQDTWEWDGEQWLERTPAGAVPSLRNAGAMAYDGARNRMVLFGGNGPTGPLNDTWEWDGQAWAQRSPPNPLPPARLNHTLTWDPRRRVLVLFGGANYGASFDDVWEWDGSSWTQRTPVGPAPIARHSHSMTFDATSNRLLMVGGCSGALPCTGARIDAWTWDGATAQWTALTLAGPQPLPRGGQGMAWDARRGTVVLACGRNGSTYYSDVWEIADGGWVPRGSVPVPAGSLTGRSLPGFAYDSARGQTVLFAGDIENNPGFLDDTWLWNGLRWTNASPATGPREKYNHAQAWDPGSAATVGFAGNPNLDETATWDSHRWTLFSPAGGPALRTNAAMSTRPDGGGVLMFGGEDFALFRDTWQRTADAGWSMRADAGPSARADMAMAPDPARDRVVLFGGRLNRSSPFTESQDTWVWNGAAWTLLNPVTKPAGRHAHTLAWNPVTQRVMMFGGYLAGPLNAINELWEWNGTDWTNRTQPGPPGVAFPPLDWDVARGRLVLFENVGAIVWEWDGTAWVSRGPARNPRPAQRFGARMTFDPVRGKPLLVGGYNSAIPQAAVLPFELWEWDAPASLQPAVQLSVQAPPVRPSSIASLRVRAFAGGEYAPFTTAEQGAQLYGWSSAGRWEPLANAFNQVGPTSSDRLSWAAAPGTEPSWVLERDAQLAFQLRPRGPNGLGGRPAQVAVDYFEVRMRYPAP